MPKTQDEQNAKTTVKVPCEVYSRIVGYLRPTRNWNRAKQQEFEDRAMFDGALQEVEGGQGE